MITLRRLGKALLVSLLSAVLVMGTMTLSAPRAEAVHPIPIFLCGPTILWACSGIGGPDVLFAGTICDKVRFERISGKTCVPFRG